MSRQGKLIASIVMVIGLSGCSTYSSVVNKMGPDKPVSDMRKDTGGELALSTTPPPFCPPETPAKPAPKYTAEQLKSLRAVLYFYFDTNKLTADSRKRAEKFYDEVIKYYAKKVYVTGYTDTSGSKSYNMALSARRAEAVKKDLIDIGVKPDIITTRAMGENNLLVPTPDGTREPKNRRVEVTVE